jgi:hypothetical protein
MFDFKFRLRDCPRTISANGLRLPYLSMRPRAVSASTQRAIFALLPCAALILLSGCSTSTAKPMVGPIIMTDKNGAAVPAMTTLAPSASVYLLVTVTDDASLGADWTVVCSSSLPPGSLPAGGVDTSCGLFTPAHTISGPVPGFVTDPKIVAQYVTQYTAPSQAPKAGTVTLAVNATALPTRSSSLTLNIR